MLVFISNNTPKKNLIKMYYIFKFIQRNAAWLGFYATIAGIGAGLILAR